MRRIEGQVILSTSDLMRFAGCAHTITLDLAHLGGFGPTPRGDAEETNLLRRLGNAHGAAHLKGLKNSGRSVVEIARGDLAAKAEETRAALAGGADAIFQGAFLDRLLREALSTIRVGTVDKLQGQEAPVCLVSMTASRADEMRRGMEFLYSRNRINVAISRAKALALVFGSPRLREAKCATIQQMQLVNTLCALPDCPRP